MPRPTWFNIACNAASPKTAEVSIHSEIGYWGVSARSFLEQLRLLGDLETINLSIHSPGGEVLDGWAIYNALKMHPAKVVVTIKGLAASMASVVMLAGDEILMPKNAYVMIHRVSGGAYGDADQMKQTADTIAKLEDGIVSAYAERSGLDEKEIRKMMEAETWLNGTEAKAKGFIDKVIGSQKAKATASWVNHFTAPPSALFDTSATSEDPPSDNPPSLDMTPDQIKALLATELKNAFADHAKNSADTVTAAVKDGVKNEITAALQPAVNEALKPINERLDGLKTVGDDIKNLTARLDKAEAVIKSGIHRNAGGTSPVNNGGEGEEAGSAKRPDFSKMTTAQLIHFGRNNTPKTVNIQ